jgi:hypothetical protein
MKLRHAAVLAWSGGHLILSGYHTPGAAISHWPDRRFEENYAMTADRTRQPKDRMATTRKRKFGAFWCEQCGRSVPDSQKPLHPEDKPHQDPGPQGPKNFGPITSRPGA